MKKITLFTLIVTLFSACNSLVANPPKKETSSKTITIPSDTKQLLVVETDDWSTKEGVLQRYQKESNHWEKVGEPISIVLGRNGLGWGVGVHSQPKDAKYVKKEGDGKAPAGLFKLKNAFGYAPTPFTMNYPYTTYKTTDHCVDDSNSIWYNQIVDSTKVKKDYKSFEHMKLQNNLYKYGIVVDHNPNQKPQAGSCIFVHIKSQSGKGTAGCTAMNQDKIIEVLKWLKEEDKPLLLQLPREEMAKVNLD